MIGAEVPKTLTEVPKTLTEVPKTFAEVPKNKLFGHLHTNQNQ